MTRECHVRFCERLRGKFLRATRQFFLGFAGYSSKAPFDPSMMVHFRNRFSEEDLKRINELIAERGKAMVIEAMSSLQDDDDSDDPIAHAGTQISLDDLVKPADWPEGKNWGTLTIDASCTPADITYPTDLKLLNEARESTQRIIVISACSVQIYPNTSLDMIVAGHVLLSLMSPNRRSNAAGR
jgi:hypothetical protein